MAPHLVNLNVRARDYSASLSWKLAQWCHEHGAEEWTVRLPHRPEHASDVEMFRAEMQLFGRAPTIRRHLSVFVSEQPVRSTELWQISPESLKALSVFLPDGLFTFRPADVIAPIWVENPIFYRRGEIMLGIVSHEQDGVLRVTRAERRDLATAGFPFHETG